MLTTKEINHVLGLYYRIPEENVDTSKLWIEQFSDYVKIQKTSKFQNEQWNREILPKKEITLYEQKVFRTIVITTSRLIAQEYGKKFFTPVNYWKENNTVFYLIHTESLCHNFLFLKLNCPEFFSLIEQNIGMTKDLSLNLRRTPPHQSLLLYIMLRSTVCENRTSFLIVLLVFYRFESYYSY